jgi:hypothetical protein
MDFMAGIILGFGFVFFSGEHESRCTKFSGNRHSALAPGAMGSPANSAGEISEGTHGLDRFTAERDSQGENRSRAHGTEGSKGSEAESGALIPPHPSDLFASFASFCSIFRDFAD